MSDEGCFWGGFATGVVSILSLVFVILSIREASKNKGSEILWVEYKNINNGASREMIEDMVKTQFPSNKW